MFYQDDTRQVYTHPEFYTTTSINLYKYNHFFELSRVAFVPEQKE